MGGPSKERPVSIQSGKACLKALKQCGYNVEKFDPKKNIIKNLKRIKPDIAFNSLHGKFGEDGQIQKILEKLKIPYTHSGVLASKNAMDKIVSKKIFIKNNLLTPKYKIIRKLKDLKNSISENKFVIKPINEGSSFGVRIIEKLSNSKLKIINNELKKYKTLLQENYIEGQEIQTAVLGGKVIGSVEIIPKRNFYDYQAKYLKSAKTKHVIPPRISKKISEKINKISIKAHNCLNCRGVTRSDFRVSKDNKIYLLETNTQPGMTKLSLVPEIAKYHGMSFKTLVNWILNDSSLKR